MTTITGHTCAHIATAALVAGGSVVAGVVVAARDGGATVFPSVSFKKKKRKNRVKPIEQGRNSPD